MLLEVIVLVLHSVVDALLDFHQRNFNFGKILTAFSQSSSGTNFKICLVQCGIKVALGVEGSVLLLADLLHCLQNERSIVRVPGLIKYILQFDFESSKQPDKYNGIDQIWPIYLAECVWYFEIDQTVHCVSSLVPRPLAKKKWKGPDHTCSVSYVKVIAKELSCSVGDGYVESRCQGATVPSCRAAALSSSYSRSCMKELVIGNNCDPLRENPAHPAQWFSVRGNCSDEAKKCDYYSRPLDHKTLEYEAWFYINSL